MPATAYAPEPTAAPIALPARPALFAIALVLAYLGLSAALIVATLRLHNLSSTAVVVTSLVMFPVCVVSAANTLGWASARLFVAVALGVGWFAEQMGSSKGWFFGRYSYTDVLGPTIGNVPIVIPMMWFVLAFTGYTLANLILWQSPVDEGDRNTVGEKGELARAASSSFIAAMIVTAYDLGADPYLVYVMKAWIMEKTDGAWFGETVQGFVGWTFIGFVIIFGFRLLARRAQHVRVSRATSRATLVPIAIYGSGVAFQATFGYPVETRSIAIFAMGIPLLCAVHGWRQWRSSVQLQAQVSR